MNIDVYDLVKILVGVIVALCVWILLRELNRINKHNSRIATLERNSINREELQKELEELSDERLRLHEENKSKLDEIIQITKDINSQAVVIARIDVRLTNVEKYQHYLQEWKHRVVDPFVPRALEEHERRLQKIESKQA